MTSSILTLMKVFKNLRLRTIQNIGKKTDKLSFLLYKDINGQRLEPLVLTESYRKVREFARRSKF